MNEIIVNRNLANAGFNIIAERYQHGAPYHNMGVQLLHKGRAVVYVEDNGAYKTEYLLDKKEREDALKTPDKFLDTMVQEWISNDDDPTLSLYQWYPERIESSFNEDSACRVLVVGCYYGFEPVGWAQNDEGKDIVFSSPEYAQDWIVGKESSPYYLQHGEAGRPAYFIIS